MLMELQILAQHREQAPGDPVVVAVRWAYHAAFDFPEDGFNLTRTIDGNSQSLIGGRKLPGAVQVIGGNWKIDPLQLEADRVVRAVVATGPQLPDKSGAASLIPALAFMLARPDPLFIASQLEAVARLFGESHLSDLSLDHQYWHGNPISDYTVLLAMANGVASNVVVYNAVVEHYRLRAKTYLVFLASHFGMAKFLGLGIEDVLPDHLTGTPTYAVEAQLWGVSKIALTDARELDMNWPAKVSRPVASQFDTTIGYPPYGRFYGPQATWKPERPPHDVMLSTSGEDTLFSHLVHNVTRGPRTYTTAMAHIQWDPRSADDHADIKSAPLLNREAYAWRIERHAFGEKTAMDDEAPVVNSSTIFEVCHDGAQVIRRAASFFEDDVDLPYGENPLEGWYAYRVAGIDLFGMIGPVSDPGLVRLRDRYAPPPPIVRIDAERVEFPADSPGTIMVNLIWDGPREYAAPDVVEFRLRQTWTPVNHFPLVVVAVMPITGVQASLNATQVDIGLANGDENPVEEALLRRFVGGTLLTSDGEFAVLSVSRTDSLRVRRSAGRAPPIGDASLRYAGESIERGIHYAVRKPALAGAVRVVSIEPFAIELLDVSNNQIQANTGRIHFHLLNLSYATEPGATVAHFVILPPDVTDVSGTTVLDALRALPAGETKAFLDNSPALFLPAHTESVPLNPPVGFFAGTLRILGSAADNAAYVTSPAGIGNESQSAEAIVLAFAQTVPTGTEWVQRIWAKDSAEYVDQATVSLEWPLMTDAVRYDVERALEVALDCTPRSSDDELINAAKHSKFDAMFGRASSCVFHPRFVDLLPGRAPTRAIYRVRGVSATGSFGEWILVALVRVPDVRIPAKPTLIGSSPHATEDRAIVCTWTQAGTSEDLGFSIEVRDVSVKLESLDRWERIADLLPNGITPDEAGRFSACIYRRPPGHWQEIRVVPVRHGLNPDDPRAILTRRIEGEPSNVMRVRANGNLLAPSNLRATVSDDGWVTLHWSNEDEYEEMELRRRAPGHSGFERIRIGSHLETFHELATLPYIGVWTYELVGIVRGRRAVSLSTRITWREK